MKKTFNRSVFGVLSMVFVSVYAQADVSKGQKIYLKKMKAPCGMSGVDFARSHTQDEWEGFFERGDFSKEAGRICPKLKFKKKYENDVYDFAVEYASDSGRTPAC